MNLPIILFGIILSTLYAAVFHFWKGGPFKRLLEYLILAWVGFWIGHLLGGFLKFTFGSIGILNTGMATIGSGVFLFVGDWLRLVDIQKK